MEKFAMQESDVILPNAGYPNAIVEQPGIQMMPTPGAIMTSWVNAPEIPADCPPGLEYLCSVDQLLVKQKVELLEAIVGFETNNKYSILNTLGQNVYYAVEDNDCCMRMCCGPIRAFNMKIFDNFKKEVMHLYRPLACGASCCPCWLQSIKVSSPPGNLIGTVHQKWTVCKPVFEVKDERNEVVCRIKGPMCQCRVWNDTNFEITFPGNPGEKGRISKQWSGLAKELLTDANNFSISFPLDLHVKTKALLFGALFLIDFMFYETSS